MKKRSLSEFLLSQMREECKYLLDNIYPKVYEIGFSKSAKQFLKNNTVFSRVYKNVDNVYANYIGEEQLLSFVERFCDDINFEQYLNDKLLLFCIPMFDRLFNSEDLGTVNRVRDLFFKIHCVKSFDEFFLNGDFSSYKPFAFKEICGIEHLMTSKDSGLSIKDSVNFLNFVNFEKEKKNSNFSDRAIYMKKLDEMYNKLYRYISFFGSDEVVLKFDSIKNSNQNDIQFYNKNEFSYDDCNLKLVEFYYGESFNICCNKYFSFVEIEKKIMDTRGEEQRKNMLLASLCYSDFCSNDFFNSFDDIHLTIEDLVNFITVYEDAGNKFSSKQASMLLRGFTKKYFYDESFEDEYIEERNIIRDSYNVFYDENFAFSDFEFIDYFNSLFDFKFKTFSFDRKSKKLDYYILKAALDDKNFGFDKLRGTKLYDDFIKGDDSKSINELIDEEEKNKHYRLNIFNRIYPLVSSYDKALVTINYFLRKNVDVGEEEVAREVFNWCGVTDLFDIDDVVVNNTIECIKSDLREDLFSNPYSKRKEVLDCYKEYIQNDGVSDKFTEDDLYKFYKGQAIAYYYSIVGDVIALAKEAKQKGENIFSVISKCGVDNIDFRKMVLKSEGNLSLYEQYKQDKELCMRQDTVVTTILEEKPIIKKASQDDNITIDNVDEILISMKNGIIMPNGEVRKYTYFDLLMQVGGDISPRDAWRALFYNIEENKDVVSKAFKDFFSSTHKHYSIINLHKELPFVEHVRGQRHVVKIGGVDHLVTEDERETVIDFIQKNNFPMYVYFDAIKSYLNGEFDPSKSLISHVSSIGVNGIADTKIMIKTDKKN